MHHGRNRYCIDKNYAGTLIIWDRMFGKMSFIKNKRVEKTSIDCYLKLKTIISLLFVLFRFRFLYVVGVNGGNYFAIPMKNVALEPATACPMLRGFPRHSLKTHGWAWAEICHLSEIVVTLTYSPYPFSLYVVYPNYKSDFLRLKRFAKKPRKAVYKKDLHVGVWHRFTNI